MTRELPDHSLQIIYAKMHWLSHSVYVYVFMCLFVSVCWAMLMMSAAIKFADNTKIVLCSVVKETAAQHFVSKFICGRDIK